MLYEVNNLKKVYDGRPVLNLESLSLEKGRVLGLLGPNGAGKTTLLQILGFLLDPSSGDLRFENKRVDFTGGRLMDLRRRVVFVQQQPILFTSTVSKNVEFPLKIRNMAKDGRNRVVEELLDLVGMGAFRYAKAHRLSGGETQRVAIARALACSPQVILLDEPTANVDVENQITIERLIKEINLSRGISVVFTTHNMVQASKLADETIFLFEGKVARSIYENIFSGRIVTDAEGSTYCVLQNGLKLRVKSKKSGTNRISIDPIGVKISLERGASPEENTLKGRLIQLTDERRRVRALVDVGIPLSVLIPKDDFRDQTLEMGEEVRVTCPVESIEVF